MDHWEKFSGFFLPPGPPSSPLLLSLSLRFPAPAADGCSSSQGKRGDESPKCWVSQDMFFTCSVFKDALWRCAEWARYMLQTTVSRVLATKRKERGKRRERGEDLLVRQVGERAVWRLGLPHTISWFKLFLFWTHVLIQSSWWEKQEYLSTVFVWSLVKLVSSLPLILPLPRDKEDLSPGFPQFSSVAQSCPALCDHMNLSTPGLPVHHHLPEFTQTHIHGVRDAIQLSHPRSSPSSPAPNPSQHQSLFQWVRGEHFSSACLLCSSQPSAENRAARTACCERSAAGVVTCTTEQGALFFQSSFWLSTGDSVKTGKCGITWLGGGLG